MNFLLVVVLSTLFLVQCLLNFRILKKTYADTVATGILVVVEEFFGLKLGNSTIEVEVCWDFFSVSVDTVPHIHIRKQWKINLIMMFWLSNTWDSICLYHQYISFQTLYIQHYQKNNATNLRMRLSEKNNNNFIVYLCLRSLNFPTKYYTMYKNWILISEKNQ